jgi:hypothetical protein
MKSYIVNDLLSNMASKTMCPISGQHNHVSQIIINSNKIVNESFNGVYPVSSKCCYCRKPIICDDQGSWKNMKFYVSTYREFNDNPYWTSMHLACMYS